MSLRGPGGPLLVYSQDAGWDFCRVEAIRTLPLPHFAGSIGIYRVGSCYISTSQLLSTVFSMSIGAVKMAGS